MEPSQYLIELRKRKIISPRITQFLDNIVLNVINGRVTSVTLRAYDSITARSLAKAGLTDVITFIKEGLPEEPLKTKLYDYSKGGIVDISKGLFQLKYSLITTDFQIISMSA